LLTRHAIYIQPILRRITERRLKIEELRAERKNAEGAELSLGQQKVQEMIAAGGDPGDVRIWAERERRKMVERGDKTAEIAAYWGDQKRERLPEFESDLRAKGFTDQEFEELTTNILKAER
jgi:hypothetical protein